jgi:hypothetical protein
MISRFSILRDYGFEIVSNSGLYCQVCRDGHYLLLQWTGQGWMAL